MNTTQKNVSAIQRKEDVIQKNVSVIQGEEDVTQKNVNIIQREEDIIQKNVSVIQIEEVVTHRENCKSSVEKDRFFAKMQIFFIPDFKKRALRNLSTGKFILLLL